VAFYFAIVGFVYFKNGPASFNAFQIIIHKLSTSHDYGLVGVIQLSS